MSSMVINSSLDDRVCVVLTTCPNRDSADRLAQELVNRKLAACVQVSQSVTSYYVWDDALQQDQEYQLSIKTQQNQLDAAFKLTLSIHPYDVPQWIVMESVAVSEAYLNWMKSSLHEV